MSKIEEILENYLQFSSVRVVGLEKIALEAMKEFGKICFEASREARYVAAEKYIEELLENNKLQYQTYEDLLEEIEDE